MDKVSSFKPPLQSYLALFSTFFAVGKCDSIKPPGFCFMLTGRAFHVSWTWWHLNDIYFGLSCCVEKADKGKRNLKQVSKGNVAVTSTPEIRAKLRIVWEIKQSLQWSDFTRSVKLHTKSWDFSKTWQP